MSVCKDDNSSSNKSMYCVSYNLEEFQKYSLSDFL